MKTKVSVCNVKDVENIDRMCLNINSQEKQGGVTRQQHWICSTFIHKKLTLETLLCQWNGNCPKTCNDDCYNLLPTDVSDQTFILKNNQNDKTLFMDTLYWIIAAALFFTICDGIKRDMWSMNMDKIHGIQNTCAH